MILLKLISLSLRYPLIGTEICPFLNYIKKVPKLNTQIKYSILIIEKNTFTRTSRIYV